MSDKADLIADMKTDQDLTRSIDKTIKNRTQNHSPALADNPKTKKCKMSSNEDIKHKEKDKNAN